MQLGERWEQAQVAVEAGLDRLQSRIWTMMPCRVLSIDASREHVKVQILVQGVKRAQNAQGQYYWQPYSMPEMPMVPIKYPEGGGWSLTFPIAENDEGTVHLASRCVDNWWLYGGEQPPLAQNGAGSLRQHNLSDGFYVPGGRSKPNFRSPVPSASSVQLRDNAGHNVISFDEDNGFSITMPGGSMSLDKNGNLRISGNITWNTSTTATDAAGHKHGSVQTGSGETGIPVAGT